MFQPTIDSHLPSRSTHVQLAYDPSPDAAALGALVLAGRFRTSILIRLRAAISRRHADWHTTRPGHVHAH